MNIGGDVLNIVSRLFRNGETETAGKRQKRGNGPEKKRGNKKRELGFYIKNIYIYIYIYI